MFKVGDEVSYGLHGKCVITGIETKELSSGTVQFYQVRSIRNPIAAKTSSTKREGLILIPVQSANSNGLRSLMTKTEAETLIKVLSDADYHFSMEETWVSKQKTLEDCIRKEGSIGLAKVVGHLFVVIKSDAVPPSSVMKFFDNVYRILLRELSDTMGVTFKDIEPVVIKALKNKLQKYS